MPIHLSWCCRNSCSAYQILQQFIFEAGHKIACKMTHEDPVIGIWCIPTKMRIAHSCHNTWMSKRYNTNPRPLSYSISDTCQEPSPTINILAFRNSKCQWEQLIIPSHPIAINNVPLYFPYKCVPSILSTGRQFSKPSIDGLNA